VQARHVAVPAQTEIALRAPPERQVTAALSEGDDPLGAILGPVEEEGSALSLSGESLAQLTRRRFMQTGGVVGRPWPGQYLGHETHFASLSCHRIHGSHHGFNNGLRQGSPRRDSVQHGARQVTG
jgi:hypothetical protein